MTTKQQERDALIKIRKIVEALGENSYIGTAFEGVFSYAEQNIDMDAAFNPVEELELARQEERAAKAAYHEEQCLRQKAEQYLQEEILERQGLTETVARKQNDITEELGRRYETEERLKAAEGQIIILKAKLYDQMTAGA